MARNIYKGWKTTVIGVVLLVAALASVFVVATVTWTSALLPIAIGIGLIFSPDDVIGRIKYLIKSKDEA